MMGLSCSRQQAKRWALELSLVLAGALIWHFARIYPWHRLYFPQASISRYSEHLPASSVSQEGPCFQPIFSASKTQSHIVAGPVGSPQEAALDNNQCYHYSSRFEPYLAQAWGNDYIPKAQERLGVRDKASITGDVIWYANLLAEHDPQLFPHVEWSNLSYPSSCPTPSPTVRSTRATTKKHRVAFVLRCYQGFTWTQDAILHLRALIWELRTSPTLPFEVDVHLLLEVKDTSNYVSMFTESGRKQILRGSVPIEFWSLVKLWSEQGMILRYPLYGDFREGIKAAGSYRGCLLPFQRFSIEHPEYDSFVNWELDTRFTHTYDHLLLSIWNYAHRTSAQNYTQWPVQGAALSRSDKDTEMCKGKSADVVVFSPVRNTVDSGWYWEYDVQGYPSFQAKPRAASVGTNLWLSKRTLQALENVTADQHRSLFCEAMVPTLVLQTDSLPLAAGEDECREQLKMVHYPHPIAFRYEASPAKLNQLLNPTSATLAKHREEVLKDTSYYYSSTIAGEIYGQWKRDRDACIGPMLLHPVKGDDRREKVGGLCAGSVSGEKCTEIVQDDIKRYLSRSIDPAAQTSLAEWDVKGERYISRRGWIMNSSNRSLVQTIAIMIAAYGVCRVLVGCFCGRRLERRHDEYIPLPAN